MKFSPSEALDWLEKLEKRFFSATEKYKAPYCRIHDFIKRKLSMENNNSSYPLGLEYMPIWELLPAEVSISLINGLNDFSRKIKGFEAGNIMGLESKTSSPIQVLRNEDYKCSGFKNLHIIGEGSGFSGGIISSGVDGIKAALSIIND